MLGWNLICVKGKNGRQNKLKDTECQLEGSGESLRIRGSNSQRPLIS